MPVGHFACSLIPAHDGSLRIENPRECHASTLFFRVDAERDRVMDAKLQTALGAATGSATNSSSPRPPSGQTPRILRVAPLQRPVPRSWRAADRRPARSNSAERPGRLPVPPLIGRGVDLALRSALVPAVLAGRWLGSRPPADGAPAARPSVGLAVKIALDEVFLLTEMLSAPLIATGDRHRLAAEISAALAFYGERGWLDDPTGYYTTPSPPEAVQMEPARSRWFDFLHLRFRSGYSPHPGEPGRERWLGYSANRTAHAWVLEHPGPPRPWLVCVPGYRMGHPLVDSVGFPLAWLHRQRGLNVVVPVMPLHGPRRIGRRSGDGFLSGDYLDTIHLQTQAVWDLRRLIGWLRAREAPAVGVYGLSLGGSTAAVLAGLDADLACVIAGMPATCYVALARAILPSLVVRAAECLGVAWDDLERLLRVVSPLALSPRVPRARRYLFAGTADRLVPLSGVTALWRHWDRPRLAWYEGTHVSFLLETTVRALLEEALEASGLVETPSPTG